MKIGYLLDAYDKLADASNRPGIEPEYVRKIEEAISKIQLLGSLSQIELIKIFFEDWRRTEAAGRPMASTDDLLNEFRSAIRAELQLEPVSGQVQWLRVSGGRPRD